MVGEVEAVVGVVAQEGVGGAEDAGEEGASRRLVRGERGFEQSHVSQRPRKTSASQEGWKEIRTEGRLNVTTQGTGRSVTAEQRDDAHRQSRLATAQLWTRIRVIVTASPRT